MNKGQLIEAVQKNLGKDTSKPPQKILQLTLYLLALLRRLKKKPVQIIGFRPFVVNEKLLRKGINPQTREPIKIKASKSVKFKPGAKLKAVSNCF